MAPRTISLFDSAPDPPCPAPFNMADYVLGCAAAMGDKAAVIVVGGDTSQRLDYTDLRAAVLGTATGLVQAGFGPGDRVLLRLGNNLDMPLAYLGCIAAGLVPVLTSPSLTAPEVARIVADVNPRLVLRDPDVPSASGPPELGLHALRSLRELPPADPDLGDPDRMGYIVYTSGTSGAPRAVAHAHRAIWARRMMFDAWYGLRADDVLLHAGAFNWTYTLGTGLMDPWSVGATALIPAASTPVERIGDLLAAHHATLFAAAPGVYRQMLSRSTLPPLPRLRHGLSAGEKMPPALHAAWSKATGTAIYEAFGMSECSTFISSAPATPAPHDTIGRPQPGRRVAILGPDGAVPIGDTGVIAVDRRDPGLMLGYLNAQTETDLRFRGDWFVTGDIGTMDADGCITYAGRDDDMMNAGGFRVSPIEVEQALLSVPGLTTCGAAEVTLGAGKSIIVLFYTGPQVLDAEALSAHAATRLARYKQPRAYVHLPTLPTGPTGKLMRRHLARHWPNERSPLQ
ncbi:MAG: class I adenylate-forming enzyme family protein [Pseudomonadota bacterium]